MELFSAFTALVAVLIALVFVYLGVKIQGQKKFWRDKGVPLYYQLPFFGIARKVFLRQVTMMDYSDYLYNLYPKARYFGMMDFATRVLIVRDPEMIKDVTVKSFDNFPDHRPFIDETTDPLFGKNIFMLKGDRWRTMRNTLTPSFTANKMRFLFELVSVTAERFVGYLADHPEMTDNMETKDAFTRYTNDVVATSAFGISINSVEDRKNEFLVRGKEVATFGGNWGFIKMILIRALPWFSKVAGITLFSKATMRFFKGVIADTLRVRREQGIVRPDMIHLLMQAKDKDSPLSRAITTDDIVAQAFGFFLAGFDTTSTFMCCMAHELAVDQDIQDKVCEEIDRVLKESNNEITYEALAKMEYLEMVMSEALRKYAPLIFMDRVCTKDVTIPGPYPGDPDIMIEKDTVILFPVYSLHNDPRYFPEPEKFDPERFSEKNKDKLVPYTYMPFGAGPRKCIGNRFVLMEAKLLFIYLLRTFRLKRSEKTVHPVVFSKKAFAPLAENGFWVRLEKKKAS